jgi:hypothetical protein
MNRIESLSGFRVDYSITDQARSGDRIWRISDPVTYSSFTASSRDGSPKGTITAEFSRSQREDPILRLRKNKAKRLLAKLMASKQY